MDKESPNTLKYYLQYFTPLNMDQINDIMKKLEEQGYCYIKHNCCTDKIDFKGEYMLIKSVYQGYAVIYSTGKRDILVVINRRDIYSIY